jgi:osmotically-inducible protein OsmY
MQQTTVNKVAGAALLFISVAFAASASAATRPTDNQITLWATAAINRDARVNNSDVAVETHDGIVTLSGEVGSLAARNFADMEAKKIRGVMGVINELSVKPADRSDEVVREAVMRRLQENPAIGTKDLHATCIAGSVSLSGTVDSWAEREQAGLLASEVAGVRNVTNDINVDWLAVRGDSEIRDDVQASLDRDVYLTDLPIEVSVRNGVVTLEGTVGNLYERDRALSGARWVRGVARVVDRLVVNWSDDTKVAATRPIPTDVQLQARVRAELDQDWRLDPTRITIDADMGDVTLRGTVNSREERTIAERDARDVVGVAWVTNRIMTEIDPHDDRIIRDDVMYRLDTDFATADLGLDATVHRGVVTLTGETFSWFERTHAAELAADVPGVKEVENLISVSPTSRQVDADLTDAIVHHLTWNWTTWRVHDDIGVMVRNGVATLTGKVNDWAQRAEATTVALNTPGIWKVDNRITVNGYNYPWSEYYYKGPYEYGLPESE